jgi:hypothetical protein
MIMFEFAGMAQPGERARFKGEGIDNDLFIPDNKSGGTTMKKLSFALLSVCLLVLLWALPVGAQSPIVTPTPEGIPIPPAPIDPGVIPELPALLRLLAGPQGWALLGVLISMLLTKWPWYKEQPSSLKQVLFVGLTAAASTLAYVLVNYIPADVWRATAPFWGIVAGVVMTWLGGNGWYSLVIQPRQAGPK